MRDKVRGTLHKGRFERLAIVLLAAIVDNSRVRVVHVFRKPFYAGLQYLTWLWRLMGYGSSGCFFRFG